MTASTARTGRSRTAGWRAALLLTAVVLATLGGTLALWMHDAGAELHARIAAREAQRTDWLKSMARRLPVRGDGAPGAAFARYVEIADLVGERSEDGLSVPQGPCIQPPHPDLARIADAVRRGAECAAVGMPAERRASWKRVFSRLFASRKIQVAIEWSARWDQQEGGASDAVERWLDLAWFGGDVARCGDCWTAYWLLDCALVSLARYATEHREVGARVATALRRLEPSLPSLEGILLSHETWQIRRVLEGPGGEASLLARARFRINQPIYLFDMLRAQDAYRGQLEACDRGWPAIRSAAARIGVDQVAAGWFGIPGAAEDALFYIRGYRRVVARLRLLLAAADHGVASGPDPFGDGGQPLRVRREPGRVVFWSVGPDGVDDGGHAPEDADGFVTWERGAQPLRDIVFVARQQPDPVSPR